MNSFEFQGYAIRQNDDDLIWICFPSGEAMTVSAEKLIEYFERIKREDF